MDHPVDVSRLTVLVVEDHSAEAALVQIMLRAEDFRSANIEVVGTLTEAVERAAVVPFDCILLDLGLPDASGLAGVEKLRSTSSALVVLTATDDGALALAAMAAGAQDYLVKGSVDGEGL